tara:strand:+ start:474 stop:1130 length:657 start_codon:yes stop_codon:yes gene_type:complete
MKILIDTLDLNEIKKYSELGIISGTTTNPTFSKRFGMKDDLDTIKQVAEAQDGVGEIYIEAFGDTADEIEDNAWRISEGSDYKDLIFKIPFTEAGVCATSKLSKSRFRINLHLVFSLSQSLIAEQVGAEFICPLIGRMDDDGMNGLEVVKEIKKSYDTNKVKTKIMGSSIRNMNHVNELIKIGVDYVTIPPKILDKMFYHKLTDEGFQTFKKDLENIG